ncbi:zinc finger-like domain-containing protein [Bradyrhizobium septentrionale]|uniref:Uncharacterized protein n=1 Tax=Bradyrhizobium septentrionale TaxID=1404411 RepID=A0A973W3G9_9BRAD|nr:zinc finger-like domain-containing protein [Bradyrhizobium septentrionale]UGY15215.1 zinc finger-like domain-containing protein [Bradyrhizobium septentrionale]
MSHFAVLVISPTELTKETIKPMLQPWHEFECTGFDDQYVVDVDKTEEVLAEYREQTRSMIRSPDGIQVAAHDDRFYRNPTEQEQQIMGKVPGTGSRGDLSWTSKDWGDGRGYRGKVHFVPDGYSKVEVPCSEVMTIAEFIDWWHSGKIVRSEAEIDRSGEHKYGYALIAENGDLIRMIDRTNPNRKWDWWAVGGRWSGMLAAPGYDPEKDPANQETCTLCGGSGKRTFRAEEIVCNKCDGRGTAVKWPSSWVDTGNHAQLKDIPLEAIRNHAEIEALKRFDEAQEVIAGRGFKRWDEVKADNGGDIDKTREAYRGQQVLKDLEEAKLVSFFDDDEIIGLFWMSRADRATRARNNALRTFAVVKDGQWYERGEMGWFGCVADEKDSEQWSREFAALLDGLPPETWLAVVDCHI